MYASHFSTARQGRLGNTAGDNLRAIFEALPDDELLDALQKTRWTGRPGYPLRVMWRTLVASFYLNIVHDTDLIRALRTNPTLAATCGIRRSNQIPRKFAYCRFRRKLTAFNELVARVLAQCIERLRENLPEFGATLAVDSTDIKAWANCGHHDTDLDAGTGAKKKSGGTHYWYGYKVHTVVDADAELPLWFSVTAANTYDGSMLPSVLEGAQARYNWLKPRYVTADKGYNSRACFDFVGETMKAIPVIDVQKRQSKEREGRACEAKSIVTSTGLHWECNRLPYDPVCPRFGKCPLLPMFADGELNKGVAGRYFERHSPFPYGSCQWKAIYNKRVSVERVFSRLKGYRKLDAIRTRGLPKVWLHVALSVLVILATAAANSLGNTADMRKCVA